MTLKEFLESQYYIACSNSDNKISIELSDIELGAILDNRLDIRVNRKVNSNLTKNENFNANTEEDSILANEFWLNRVNINETLSDGSIIYRPPLYRGYGVVIKYEKFTDIDNKESIYYPQNTNNRAVRLLIRNDYNYELIKLNNKKEYFENAPKQISGEELSNKLHWKMNMEQQQYQQYKAKLKENEEPTR
ncbi:MAG: hypothetical protein OHM56_03035 [Spiroplasma phoeniceum]|nr:MAG: hypothetical protein OHM57_02485 [Spiroplasma phoeniceum]UZQ32940.1 MAG: hypothetical protein OHM56_03035 [Spiroplasma phoeniceum]